MLVMGKKKLLSQNIINLYGFNDWCKDENKYGKRLLEKMGWKTGQGLGVNNQGPADNVRLRSQIDTKGFGYRYNPDEDWLKISDTYSKLLSSLNDVKRGNDTAQVSLNNSLETRSESSKARLHYRKFTRSKDLTRYSEKDLTCIFGISSKSGDAKISHVMGNDCNVEENTTDEENTESGCHSQVFSRKRQNNLVKLSTQSSEIDSNSSGKDADITESEGCEERSMECVKVSRKKKKVENSDSTGNSMIYITEHEKNNFSSSSDVRSSSSKKKWKYDDDENYGQVSREENELEHNSFESSETILDGKSKKRHKKQADEKNLLNESHVYTDEYQQNTVSDISDEVTVFSTMKKRKYLSIEDDDVLEMTSVENKCVKAKKRKNKSKCEIDLEHTESSNNLSACVEEGEYFSIEDADVLEMESVENKCAKAKKRKNKSKCEIGLERTESGNDLSACTEEGEYFSIEDADVLEMESVENKCVKAKKRKNKSKCEIDLEHTESSNDLSACIEEGGEFGGLTSVSQLGDEEVPSSAEYQCIERNKYKKKRKCKKAVLEMSPENVETVNNLAAYVEQSECGNFGVASVSRLGDDEISNSIEPEYTEESKCIKKKKTKRKGCKTDIEELQTDLEDIKDASVECEGQDKKELALASNFKAGIDKQDSNSVESEYIDQDKYNNNNNSNNNKKKRKRCKMDIEESYVDTEVSAESETKSQKELTSETNSEAGVGKQDNNGVESKYMEENKYSNKKRKRCKINMEESQVNTEDVKDISAESKRQDEKELTSETNSEVVTDEQNNNCDENRNGSFGIDCGQFVSQIVRDRMYRLERREERKMILQQIKERKVVHTFKGSSLLEIVGYDVHSTA